MFPSLCVLPACRVHLVLLGCCMAHCVAQTCGSKLSTRWLLAMSHRQPAQPLPRTRFRSSQRSSWHRRFLHHCWRHLLSKIIFRGLRLFVRVHIEGLTLRGYLGRLAFLREGATQLVQAPGFNYRRLPLLLEQPLPPFSCNFGKPRTTSTASVSHRHRFFLICDIGACRALPSCSNWAIVRAQALARSSLRERKQPTSQECK